MFKAYLKDGNLYIAGQDLQNSKWNKIPNIPIVKLEYKLYGINFTLEGFEEYNHLVHYRNILFKKIHEIYKVTILAKSKYVSYKFEFDLIKGKFDRKIIDEKDIPKCNGWKIGIVKIPPTVR